MLDLLFAVRDFWEHNFSEIGVNDEFAHLGL